MIKVFGDSNECHLNRHGRGRLHCYTVLRLKLTFESLADMLSKIHT